MSTAPFGWSEYLRLADELSQNTDEASHRTSISRAYYSVYHIASARAVGNGYVDKKSHTELWRLFNRNSDRGCRKLAAIGLRMKKERVKADYEATVARIPDRMNQQIVLARNFLTRLTALPPALPKP